MKIVSSKLLRRENGYEVRSETSLIEFDVEVMDDAGDPDGAQEFVEQLEDSSGRLTTLLVAYNLNGEYIGDVERAKVLCEEMGIRPEALPGHEVCSIGFCERDQKWFGWSHRAIYGFGIGSEVGPGDCAYQPKDKEDFRQDCLRFWKEDYHEKTWAVEERGNDGESGVLVSWKYSNAVPNEKLRSKISGQFTPYPDKFGRGEWTAKTLDDAKRMAAAFAESVG